MLALLMASSSPRFEEVALASVLAIRKKSASPIASLAAATYTPTTAAVQAQREMHLVSLVNAHIK